MERLRCSDLPAPLIPLYCWHKKGQVGISPFYFTFFFLFINSREGKLQTQDLLCSECEQFHTHAFSPKKCPGFGSDAIHPMDPGCRRSLVPSAAALRDGGSVLNPPSRHGSWCCRGKQPSAKRSGSLDSYLPSWPRFPSPETLLVSRNIKI